MLYIKQLQDIGMSLEDIQKFFKTNSQVNVVDQLSKALDMQEQNVRAQIDKLRTSLNKIRALQTQCSIIVKSFHYADVNHLIIRELREWLHGGETAKKYTPLGYCGAPADIDLEKAKYARDETVKAYVQAISTAL